MNHTIILNDIRNYNNYSFCYHYLYYFGILSLLTSHMIRSIPNNINKKYCDYLDLYASTINIVYYYHLKKTPYVYLSLTWYITSLISCLKKNNKNIL